MCGTPCRSHSAAYRNYQSRGRKERRGRDGGRDRGRDGGREREREGEGEGGIEGGRRKIVTAS